MKKILLPIVVIALLFACKSGESNDKGLALISKSDCLTCHKVDQQLTGPSYQDVANKYGAMPDTIINYLVKKIRAGGTGNWGEIFMVPHPQISEEDAKAMVKYILSLKK
jgi:cytochrome c